MMGREKGGEERIVEDVDLPVAMEPVRPMRSMAAWGYVWGLQSRNVALGK